MTRPVVVVTRRLPEHVEAVLRERFDVALNSDDRALGPAELHEALRRADGVLCTVTDRVDATVIGSAPRRCRLLANFGVGVNHIDLPAARAAGIAVSNTPDVLTDATADLAIGLMLAVSRRMMEGDRLVRAGAWQGWSPTQLLGSGLSGRTLGLVGFGRIGRAVAHRAALGFGMRILFFTPREGTNHAADGFAAERCASLDELLDSSDFVSLHCPATAETRHLIDAARLARMRPGAYLINTARGDIVDESALVDALRRKVIAGAALDVYEREPAMAEGLVQLDTAVLLPHLGSATEATRIAMGLRAVQNLVACFAGRDVPDRID